MPISKRPPARPCVLRVYVGCDHHGRSTVTPISTRSDKARRPIRVGRYPGFIAISANGKTVYSVGTYRLSAISITTNKARKPIRIGGGTPAIVISPDSKTVYVADGNTLLRINAAKLRVTRRTGLSHRLYIWRGHSSQHRHQHGGIARQRRSAAGSAGHAARCHGISRERLRPPAHILSDNTRGVARHQRHTWHIRSHDAARRYHRTVTDCHSGEDRGTSAYPDIVSDNYRL